MRIAIIGGLGHVGLPLGLVLADVGHYVALIDRDQAKINEALAKRMPFVEQGADVLLKRLLGPSLWPYATTDIKTLDVLRESDAIIITVGTPLDEYQNPRLDAVTDALKWCGKLLDGKLVILRSTVFPGTTRHLGERLARDGIKAQLAFCPERILQGEAMSELRSLPQIVAGYTPEAAERAAQLFSTMGVRIVMGSVGAAELAKLFLNAWRYVTFAVPNEFYSIAAELGAEYGEVERLMKEGYERANALPSPGFAAGPCLLKDTMQLVAASRGGFSLGMAARAVNEGLPEAIVRKLHGAGALAEGKTVAILGMAFKADNDDIRDSLSFRLKKLLAFSGVKVICSDPYAKREDIMPDHVSAIADADAVCVAVPHHPYRKLAIPAGKLVIDFWNVTTGGTRI